jgi:hypothetical protein
VFTVCWKDDDELTPRQFPKMTPLELKVANRNLEARLLNRDNEVI